MIFKKGLKDYSIYYYQEMSDKTENKISKEKKKEYNNKYYSVHREDLLARIKEKKLCTCCGNLISASNYSRHVKNGCVAIEDNKKTKKNKLIKKIKDMNQCIEYINKEYETNIQPLAIPE